MRYDSSRRFDVGLIVSSLLLGGYLVFTQAEPTTSELSTRADHLLLPFSSSELQALHIKSQQGELTLVADPEEPGEFRLQGDTRGRVDTALLRQLVSALQFATFKRKLDRLPPGISAQSPGLLIEIRTPQRSTELRFFSETPISDQSERAEVYVSVHADEKTAFGVVDKQLLTTLKRSKQEFRGTALFPFSIETTLSIDIKSSAGELELVADPLGFVINESQKRADRGLTDILFYHLAQASIETFLAQNEAEQITSESTHHYEITQRGAGQDVHVRVGGTCPGDPSSTVAARTTAPRIAGCIKRSIFAGLNLTPSELTDRTASIMTRDEIDHVVVQGPDRSLDLLRKDAGFVLASRDQRPVPVEAGEEFLRVLSEGKLNLIDEVAAPGGPTLTMTITGNPREKALDHEPWHVKDRNASPPTRRLVLDIYLDNQPAVLHRKDDDAWLEIPRALEWAFSQDDSWARPRKLSGPSSEEIEWARIVRPGEDPQTVRRKGAQFVLDDKTTSPPGGQNQAGASADQTLSRRLLEDLGQLEATRMLSETTPPTPIWYSIEFGASGESHRLMVGERVRGGYLSWSDLSSTRFILPYEVGISLSTPLSDRSAAQIDPHEFSRLEIRMDQRTIVLLRVAGELQSELGDFQKEAVAPLLEEVRGLTVLAHFKERTTVGPALIQIQGTLTGPPETEYLLEIIELTPYLDTLAYEARVKGHPGTYILSAESVRSLQVML